MEQDILLLARIIEKTPVGIVVVTTAGTIQYMNHYAEELFNVKRETLLGQPIEPFIGVSLQSGTTWDQMWEQLVKGVMTETTLMLQPVDRDDTMCKVTLFSIGANEQYSDSLAMTFRDITQEILFNEQIEKKNLEMAKMNSELIRWNAELKRVSEL